MNICFSARPSFRAYSPKIFLDIRERYDKSAQAIFVSTNKKEANDVRKTYPDAVIYETSAFLKEHWDEFTFERFCEYEKKYECAPLWKYIYTDRFLIHRDYDYVIKVTTGLFLFFETIFNKHKIDVYYSETIATLQCYVAYLVGKKTGTAYYAQTGARGLDATHQYVMDDPFNRIVLMEKNYMNMEYSHEEMSEAKTFLQDFLSKESKPVYMQITGKKPRLQLRFLLLIGVRLFKRFDSRYNDPCSYMYYESYKWATDPIKFYFRYQYCKKYYHKADLTKKFVLYPLHFQPEASTCVCAQKYEKQLFFIDSWAKSLPADTLLYVKEHYAILGHREVSFYNELRKYPNVVLIDPWENTRDLIKHAEAVTTLTGTAGWEAMLMRKPVFIGGNIFFDDAPGVIKVEDIYDHYLDNMAAWKQPTEEELLKYLCAYRRALHYGRNWYADSDENIHNVVDGLMSVLAPKYLNR